MFPQALKRSDAAGFMSELKLRPPYYGVTVTRTVLDLIMAALSGSAL